jgi:4-amino-4-deoxy-L-arabinose transferase
VLVASFLLKLRHLDHTALTRWDEVFHAIVAQNLLKHPLKPTLFDSPYLPYETAKWGENHVWLHKPTLPLWQIALSFAVLGVSTFALRLPSAILSTAAAWLTYLIGTELLDRRAAVIAAVLQAINPFLLSLVHGYNFADHIDVALLFWVEVGLYFLVRTLRTGSWRDVVLAGVAQGIAFLCKSYLAFIIFGIALTAWLLPICRLAKREDCRIGPLRLLGLFGTTLLIIAPWLAYCLTNYPDEFWHEQEHVWLHLSTNIEGWGAPWDRLVFDYLIGLYGVFYGPIVVASAALFASAVARRHAGLLLVYAWGLGVILPHLAATTKTPSATVIAVPPLLLLLGQLISEAWRSATESDRSFWPLAVLTGAMAMSLIFPAVIPAPGYGYPNPRVFGALMGRSMWLIYQVAGALVIAGALMLERLVPGNDRLRRYFRWTAFAFSAAVLAWLAIDTLKAGWRVADRNAGDPASVEVGEFTRNDLPENAALICLEGRGYEHLAMMFYTDRTCYSLGHGDLDRTARRIVDAGGIPYVVSRRRLSLVPAYVSDRRGPNVYRWQPRQDAAPKD